MAGLPKTYILCGLVLAFLVTFSSARYHSFEEDVTLSKKQKELLDVFKDRVTPFLPHDYMKEPMYLIRWLRARNFDLRNAETALLKNLKWREDNKMDSILDEDFSDFEADYKTWNEGRTKTGKPIWYFETATHDVRKAIVTGKTDRYLRYVDRCLERMSTLVRELGDQYGNVTRAEMLLNMEGYNVIVHGCSQCVPILLRMITSFQEHWPGVGDNCILVNTPAILEPFLNVAKSIMVPEHRDSFQVYGVNKNHYIPILSKEFDFDMLPPGVGGSKLYKGMEEDY